MLSARGLSCLFLFCVTPAFATTSVDFSPPQTIQKAISKEDHQSHWLVGMGGGVDALWFDERVNVLVNSTTGLPDTFTEEDMTKIEGLFLASVGRRWGIGSPDNFHYVTLSLEYNYFGSSDVDGVRVDIGNNASNYFYTVKRQSLLLIGKFDLYSEGQFFPYIEGGIGVSRLTFENFSNPNAVSPMVPFPNNTSYSFAGLIGLGLDYQINQHILMSIGYRLACWGELSSGSVDSVTPAPPPPFPSTFPPIALTHTLFSNAGIIAINYLW